MKTATATVVTVELTCPHCGEAIECPLTGSFVLDEASVRKLAHWEGPGYTGTAVHEVISCYKRFKLPAAALKMLD